MSDEIDSEVLEINGTSVRVKYFHDGDREPPWEDDGHGPVRKTAKRHREYGDKRPGERPLNQPDRNEYQFYYDWQAAVKEARKDGWNTEPYDAPNRVLRAVQSDFDFLRGYLSDQWHYVGIEVQLLDQDGEPVGDADSCWGFETWKDYHKEAARDMATMLVSSNHEDLRTMTGRQLELTL